MGAGPSTGGTERAWSLGDREVERPEGPGSGRGWVSGGKAAAQLGQSRPDRQSQGPRPGPCRGGVCRGRGAASQAWAPAGCEQQLLVWVGDERKVWQVKDE